MTIQQALDRADEIKPNAIPSTTKTAWLASLDGRIAANIFLMSVPDIRNFSYSYPEDADVELLVYPPHDELYPLYLAAKIDEANGEYDKYANSSAIYNAAYTDFARWFATVYAPAQGYDRRRW